MDQEVRQDHLPFASRRGDHSFDPGMDFDTNASIWYRVDTHITWYVGGKTVGWLFIDYTQQTEYACGTFDYTCERGDGFIPGY